MPDTWSRRAAEEILISGCMHDGRCKRECASYEMHVENIAAIIERHAGEREKVLRVAAKWAARDGGCPYGVGSCMHNENCYPIYEQFTYEDCWLEYWKKEAERCEK